MHCSTILQHLLNVVKTLRSILFSPFKSKVLNLILKLRTSSQLEEMIRTQRLNVWITSQCSVPQNLHQNTNMITTMIIFIKQWQRVYQCNKDWSLRGFVTFSWCCSSCSTVAYLQYHLLRLHCMFNSLQAIPATALLIIDSSLRTLDQFIIPCKIGCSQNLVKERYLGKTPFLTFFTLSTCTTKQLGVFFGNSKKMFLWMITIIISEIVQRHLKLHVLSRKD